MQKTVRALVKNPTSLAGIIILTLIVAIGLLAPYISGDPTLLAPKERLLPPSGEHLLGTDEMGRDLWTMIAFGARSSLFIATTCTLLAIVIGFVIGILSGYFRPLDAVLMRIMDGLMAFPNIILVLSLVGVLGRGMGPVIFGLTVVLVPPIARVVRSAALAVKTSASVESARSIGASDGWILAKYVAPESASVLIVQSTMGFAQTVLSIAALSFLGIGLPPEVPSWGASLSAAQQYMQVAWWIAVFPGIAILLTVLSLILIGDGLRDWIDPRARKLNNLSKMKRVVKRAERMS